MKRHHPSSILLLLLLALCVLDAGFTGPADLEFPAVAIELEEKLQEGKDNQLEEEGSFGTDLIGFDFFTRDVAPPSDLAQRLTGACTLCPSLCSFGWVLPLRI